MTKNIERFFVVTGGPGSGKTALLNALADAGYNCSVEAGRGVIQDQMAVGGAGLPWKDRALFSELMLSWEMRSYRQAEQYSGPSFFDRSVVDVIGYLRLVDLAVPPHIEKAVEVFRYHRRVFIAPLWEEIYRQDHERKQDFAEAVRSYEAMAAVYPKYGYELVELPRVSVIERVHFVLNSVGVPRSL